jgi:hypothetical protein
MKLQRNAELQPFIDEVQRKYWAMNEATGAYKQAEAALRKAVGPGHDFTSEACWGNKIGGHIYTQATYKGLGRRKCILCNCDDFDLC